MNRRLNRLEHLMTLTDDELEGVAAATAEAHLDACYEYLVDREDGIAEDRADPATSPFCGCHTCTVREVLRSVWPVMQEIARRDRIRRSN